LDAMGIARISAMSGHGSGNDGPRAARSCAGSVPRPAADRAHGLWRLPCRGRVREEPVRPAYRARGAGTRGHGAHPCPRAPPRPAHAPGRHHARLGADSEGARMRARGFAANRPPPHRLRRCRGRPLHRIRAAGFADKTFGALQFFLTRLCLQAKGPRPSGRGSPGAWVERARRLGARTRPGGVVTFAGAGLAASSARFASCKLLELARPALWTDME